MKKESNSSKASKFLQEGIRLDDLKEYQRAIEAYDMAIKLLPNDHAAYHNKSLSLASLGRDEEALEAYDIAMNLNPSRYDEIYYETLREELMRQDLEKHLAQGKAWNLRSKI